MKKTFIIIGIIMSFMTLYSQDSHKKYNVNKDERTVYQYARQVVDTLSSPFFHGRGYTKESDQTSALFVATEMYRFGMKRFKTAMTFYQNFNLSVNVFPEEVLLSLDERFLQCGIDFLPSADCPDIKGNYPIVWLDSTILSNEKNFKKFSKQDFKNKFIVMDDKGVKDDEMKKVFDNLKKNPFGAKGLIFLKDKLMWTVATETSAFAKIDILRSKINKTEKEIRLIVNSEFIENFPNRNVIAYIEGKQVPDTFIIVSAHYDHLGQIGRKVFFPGANDNASGIAMMLSLARYYSITGNEPKYSIAFIGFGSEEAGLIGSKKYVFAPIIPLEKTKFLLNLDIMGTGDEGITVVNATEFPKQFHLLDSINNSYQFISQIKKRGPAANSDHYYFYENGVPCFFIYTMGGVKAYHDLYDRSETLPLNKFEDIHKLLVKFIDKL